MSKTSPQNLIIKSVRNRVAVSQAIQALRTLDDERQNEHATKRLLAVADRLQETTVVNDRPDSDFLYTYTVVTMDEPDCDGQTYSLQELEAPNAPFADVLGEILAGQPAVAVYDGKITDEIRDIWAPRWNSWVADDTIGTILQDDGDTTGW